MNEVHSGALPALMDQLSARWMAGSRGAALTLVVPETWQPLLAKDIDLMALVGQCRQFLTLPVPPEGLHTAPRFPAPALPLLPAQLRLMFRRALVSLPSSLLPVLLTLLATRGYMAHPFDWRPTRADDALPPVYDAWRAWALQRDARDDVEDAEWGTLTQAQRRHAWLRLRERDPAQARAVFQQQLPQLPAEQRLLMVDALTRSLGPEDLPLLQGLANDRSEKIRLRARFLRARLGVHEPLSEMAASELRADFECRRSGLLRRKTTVTVVALKTAAQRSARRERLSTASWADLASVLELQSIELATALQLDSADHDARVALWQCAEHSADQAVVSLLVERVLFDASATPQQTISALALAQRLAVVDRQTLAVRALSARGTALTFMDLAELAQAPLPLAAPALFTSHMWLTLIANQGAGADTRQLSSTKVEAAALGCLLPRVTAQAALDALIVAGVQTGEPLLDLLRLNALLPDTALSQGSSA